MGKTEESRPTGASLPLEQPSMEDVLQLLNQRMSGQATTAEVETAVSRLLTAMNAPAAATTPTAATANESSRGARTSSAGVIRGDSGNYDDSSSDENDKEAQKKPAVTRKRRRSSRIAQNDINGGETKQDDDDDDYEQIISRIPMGKEAVKMMTTFGDGPKPCKEALEEALMGTRRALQITIMDARKVRRRLQKDYKDAQAIITPKWSKSKKANPTVAAAAAWQKKQQEDDNDTKDGTDKCDQPNNNATPSASPVPKTSSQLPASANSIDPRLIYRALAEGTDKLSYLHKCGFHMEELTHLYPEEMRAYQRWNEMHEEYKESKADDGGDKDPNKKSPRSDKDNKDDDSDEEELDGGHLKERAANFDFRTDQMKNDWYVEYAKVRQGSFLPSGHVGRRGGRSKTEAEWETLRKQKKGRHLAGSWENLSAKAVRFLHWLGFDPPNLFPPDEETTHALAFLAYDRLGRIVEKAIFLRNEQYSNKRKKQDTNSSSRSLWELPDGERLSKEDIERALNDPDIKPATIYGTETDPSSSSFSTSSVQLYFGPGWEDRLELEMEE